MGTVVQCNEINETMLNGDYCTWWLRLVRISTAVISWFDVHPHLMQITILRKTPKHKTRGWRTLTTLNITTTIYKVEGCLFQRQKPFHLHLKARQPLQKPKSSSNRKLKNSLKFMVRVRPHEAKEHLSTFSELFILGHQDFAPPPPFSDELLAGGVDMGYYGSNKLVS